MDNDWIQETISGRSFTFCQGICAISPSPCSSSQSIAPDPGGSPVLQLGRDGREVLVNGLSAPCTRLDWTQLQRLVFCNMLKDFSPLHGLAVHTLTLALAAVKITHAIYSHGRMFQEIDGTKPSACLLCNFLLFFAVGPSNTQGKYIILTYKIVQRLSRKGFR